MLSGLLERYQCAACRYCCVFDRSDFWETPSLLEPTAKAILAANPTVSLVGDSRGYSLATENLTDGLYPCPALTPSGCGLPSELKPFECSIWPFRVMWYEGTLVLAVCNDCEGLREVPTETVDAFANARVRDLAFTYASKHPNAVKEYHPNYRIVSA